MTQLIRRSPYSFRRKLGFCLLGGADGDNDNSPMFNELAQNFIENHGLLFSLQESKTNYMKYALEQKEDILMEQYDNVWMLFENLRKELYDKHTKGNFYCFN